ncbi:MAG TPA: sulfite exporter TauE/SafE family protein, partial [Anaerolineae bacterium]
SSLGGAPMALVYQSEAGPRIRGTLSTIFVAGTIISIAGLWWVGRFGVVEFVLGVLLMPGVVVGYNLSHSTSRWIDRFDIRPAILAVSALSAVVILVRAFV